MNKQMRKYTEWNMTTIGKMTYKGQAGSWVSSGTVESSLVYTRQAPTVASQSVCSE